MIRLRPREGTPGYEYTVTFTIRSTSRYKQTRPFGERLVVLREKLRQADENVTVVMRAQTEATADRVFNDYEDDDLVREINAEAKQEDRRNPTLGLQKALFPDGLEAVVSRSGDYQVNQMKRLGERLDSVKGRAAEFVERYKPQLEAATEGTNAALKAQADAFEETRSARSKLQLVKVEIREEMEVVYAELRKLFRSTPKKAERFFPPSKTKKAALTEPTEEEDVDEVA